MNGTVFIILGIIIVRSMREDVFNYQTIEAITSGIILFLLI